MQTSEIVVLVIGAGPVGLTMANELTRRGISCRIIDKNSAPTDKSKALVVHARTLEVLDNMGLAANFVAAGLRAKGMKMWINGSLATTVVLGKIDSTYPFPLLIEQSTTEHLFIEHLAEQGIQVEREIELTDFSQDSEGVTTILKHADGTTEQVRCKYLVGCDGAHSTVRHKLNIAFEGKAYRELQWLADVHVDWEVEPNFINIFIDKKVSMLVIPMIGGHYRLIITLPEDSKVSSEDLTLEEVQEQVDLIMPGFMRLSEPRWLTVFHTHHRKVDRFYEGRVFLAGDAAHIHSPTGGQGMNTGIQDAHNLTWKLAQVLRGQAEPQILDSYQAERNPIAEKVLKQTDLIFRASGSNNPIFSQVRNHLIPVVTSLAIVREKLQKVMLQLDINYRNSPFVSHTEHNSGHLRSGDYAPYAPLTIEGQPQIQSLYDLFRQGQYTLLLLSGKHPTAQAYRQLVELGQEVNEKYGKSIQTCLVTASEQLTGLPQMPGRVGLDLDLVVHHKYEARLPMLCLVRPDGYIAFYGPANEHSKLESYLSQILVSAEKVEMAV